MKTLTSIPFLSLLALLLGAFTIGLAGCPSGDDDDSSVTDDDDATGDDDDSTAGDDDDSTAGDDDDSAGLTGSCLFERAGAVVACDQGEQAQCSNDDGPPGITVTWVPGQGCPAGQTATCTTGDPSPWFYYLDQADELLDPWCGRCAAELQPADYCDSVGGIGGGDDDDSANGDDDDSANGDDDDSANGDDDDSAR